MQSWKVVHFQGRTQDFVQGVCLEIKEKRCLKAKADIWRSCLIDNWSNILIKRALSLSKRVFRKNGSMSFLVSLLKVGTSHESPISFELRFQTSDHTHHYVHSTLVETFFVQTLTASLFSTIELFWNASYYFERVRLAEQHRGWIRHRVLNLNISQSLHLVVPQWRPLQAFCCMHHRVCGACGHHL